jgi:hypothetical protein
MTEGEEKTQAGPTSEPPSENVSTEELARKLDNLQLERLTELHKSLRETEARIDQKLANFKRFVDVTEISGRALAGPQVQETEEEKAKKAAMKLLEGTGLTF